MNREWEQQLLESLSTALGTVCILAVYAEFGIIHPGMDDANQRRVLYDLYHWLNHFNLFGVTYLGQVENSVDFLLSTMD